MKLMTRGSSTVIFLVASRPDFRVGFIADSFAQIISEPRPSRIPGIFGIPALLCPQENPMSSTENLKPGLKGTAELIVGEEHTAPRVGSGRVHVLATPVMINVIEAAALAAIEHLLPAGHQSLGTRLDIRHFAATPVGMRVRAGVEVVKVEGRTVTFRVAVNDEKEPIGDGMHERMIVNVARFDVRVQDKVAMVRGRT